MDQGTQHGTSKRSKVSPQGSIASSSKRESLSQSISGSVSESPLQSLFPKGSAGATVGVPIDPLLSHLQRFLINTCNVKVPVIYQGYDTMCGRRCLRIGIGGSQAISPKSASAAEKETLFHDGVMLTAKSMLSTKCYHGTAVKNALSILSGGAHGFEAALSGDRMKGVCLANHPPESYFRGALFECAVNVFQANWRKECRDWPEVPLGIGIFQKKGTKHGELVCNPSDVVAHSLWVAADELDSVLREWEANPKKMHYGGGACYGKHSGPIGQLMPKKVKLGAATDVQRSLSSQGDAPTSSQLQKFASQAPSTKVGHSWGKHKEQGVMVEDEQGVAQQPSPSSSQRAPQRPPVPPPPPPPPPRPPAPVPYDQHQHHAFFASFAPPPRFASPRPPPPPPAGEQPPATQHTSEHSPPVAQALKPQSRILAQPLPTGAHHRSKPLFVPVLLHPTLHANKGGPGTETGSARRSGQPAAGPAASGPTPEFRFLRQECTAPSLPTRTASRGAGSHAPSWTSGKPPPPTPPPPPPHTKPTSVGQMPAAADQPVAFKNASKLVFASTPAKNAAPRQPVLKKPKPVGCWGMPRPQ